MKTFLAFICLVAGLPASSQSTGTLRFSFKNFTGLAMENAAVQLRKSKDSSLVKVGITGHDGEIEFQNINFGTYLLYISPSDQVSKYYGPYTLSSVGTITIPAITLEQVSVALKEIVVNTKKPFIQKLSDRIVVNVDNAIVNAGSSAMDVLERSPGITVDQNDAISLRGKQGVIIMIDGKPSPMKGTDLANYLKSLSSNSIDRIDIITNPSSKYEAAGNAGIIDIHMKKDLRVGSNGTVTLGAGHGIYPKANTGLTFNYRNKMMNVFGSYNYGYRKNLNHLILDRNFFTNGTFSGEDNKDNYTISPYQSHNVRLGADFFRGKKTIIGFILNGNFNSNERTNDNNSIVINAQKNPVYTFKAFSNDHGSQSNMLANINYKHTFDSLGRELTADIDYGTFISHSLSSIATKYYDLNGGALQPDYILKGDQPGKLTLRTGKVDYVHPLAKNAKIETGFKASYVSSDNDARFFDASSGIPVNDTNKTNHFFYNEYNTAGYVNYNREFKKFSIMLGLRGEQTDIKTSQVKGDIRFDSGYFKLFPSAFINYKMKGEQTLGFSVSRRIDRPGYSQLNPFLFLIDVSTYATGAPGLLPQFTWSYEFSYTVKSFNFTLGYSHTTHDQNIAIARFRDVFPNIIAGENVTVQIPINLASSDYAGLTVAAPIKINKWWNMINNGNLYYQHYNGSLGGTILNNGTPAFDLRSDNSFILKKGWSAELNAVYNSGGQYGFMVGKPQWGLSAGLQKIILKNKGSLKFNVTDIFWTNLPRGVITYNNYKEYWHAFRESRVGTLSFTYRFGNSKVQGARKRTTGSEEERRRAGN